LQKQQNVLVRVLVSAINQKHNPFVEQLIEKLLCNFNVHGMALLAELMVPPVDVQKIRIVRTTKGKCNTSNGTCSYGTQYNAE
jgi:hypothetical protein